MVAKRRAAEFEEDDTDEEDELESELKCPKFAEGGLLEFEGPVSDSIDVVVHAY